MSSHFCGFLSRAQGTHEDPMFENRRESQASGDFSTGWGGGDREAHVRKEWREHL